jgi:putative protein-disulfide isomerase
LSEQGFDTMPEEFLSVWQSAEAVAETQSDFLKARQWGISSFPSLLLEDGNKVYSVSPGYVDAAQLVSRVRTVAGSRAA